MKNNALILLILSGTVALMLSGCSTSKDEILPPGDSTMLELWNNGASTTHATAESRTTLRRPVSDSERTIGQQTGTATAAPRKMKFSRRFRDCPIRTW